jgi:hypothetical protein
VGRLSSPPPEMPIMAGWKACPTKTAPAPERLNTYQICIKAFALKTKINYFLATQDGRLV